MEKSPEPHADREREKDIRDIFWKLFPLYFAFSGERRLTFKELGGTFQPNTLTNYILF